MENEKSKGIPNIPSVPKTPNIPKIPKIPETPKVTSQVQTMPTNDGQGKNWAIACLVLGIVSIVFCVFGYGALLGIIAAIIGLVGSRKAKKGGYKGGIQTAGFVCSIIGLVLCALVFLYCLIILGLAASFLGAFSY